MKENKLLNTGLIHPVGIQLEDGEANFLAPAMLRYAVCKQCRVDAYKKNSCGRNFSGWNDYAEAWWSPCLTTTPFSFGQTILRTGYICCPPQVFMAMQKEIATLIAQNFSGDKKELLLSTLSTIPQQKCNVVDQAPDWCPHQMLHAIKKRETIEIFGAATINKEIRFAMRCNCGHEWYIKEDLSKSTSTSGGIFVTNSIPTKQKVICQLCGQKSSMAVLKRLFFYGE
jgi:hypothetical protein